jgi:hypothetical protein
VEAMKDIQMRFNLKDDRLLNVCELSNHSIEGFEKVARFLRCCIPKREKYTIK